MVKSKPKAPKIPVIKHGTAILDANYGNYPSTKYSLTDADIVMQCIGLFERRFIVIVSS